MSFYDDAAPRALQDFKYMVDNEQVSVGSYTIALVDKK